jgi:cellulose synthase/poly-beta-1,6-N-acetylglucosamine synthase-like glycosyltransferase
MIFTATAAALAWAWAGYLAFLKLLVRFHAHPRPAPPVPGSTPSVGIIVLAHNEEAAITGKLENSLALDWPRDRLRVLVASDGSTDRTNDIVAGHPSPRVALLARSRRGRALMSNEAVVAADAEWLLFTDAETRLEPDVLRRMQPHFARPDVGMVDAELVSANADASAIAGDLGLYWKLESALKTAESACGCLSSTFGACSAVRRSIFEPLDATEDVDFRTPLNAIAKGYRVIHEPTAHAYEVGHSDVRDQFRARVRMVTKNLPGTIRHCDRRILRRPLVTVGIVSHKLLRWATPFLLAANLLGSLRIANPRGRALALGAHGAFALAGAAGAWAWRRGQRLPVASSVFSFVVANAGFAVGVVNSLRGIRIATYDPSHELREPPLAQRGCIESMPARSEDASTTPGPTGAAR